MRSKHDDAAPSLAWPRQASLDFYCQLHRGTLDGQNFVVSTDYFTVYTAQCSGLTDEKSATMVPNSKVNFHEF